MFAPLIPMDLFKKWSRFRNFHDVVGGGGVEFGAFEVSWYQFSG